MISRGVEDNPAAVIRPPGYTRIHEISYRFVGDESQPSLDKIQHVDLIRITPIRTEPRGMALHHIGKSTHGFGGIGLDPFGERTGGPLGHGLLLASAETAVLSASPHTA